MRVSRLIPTKNIMMVCLAGGGLIIATLSATAYTGQELAKGAKISMAEARAVALKAHPGEITDEELEKERGGLRYSFDICGAITQELGVDAQTGRVLEAQRNVSIPTRVGHSIAHVRLSGGADAPGANTAWQLAHREMQRRCATQGEPRFRFPLPET